MSKQNEKHFQDWFFENAPSKFKELQREVPLYDAYCMLEYQTHASLNQAKAVSVYNIIGRIDFIFRYKSQDYVAEVKRIKNSSSDFWYASKAILYSSYYNWQADKKTKPAIIIKKSKIKLEHLIAAGHANMKVFGFEKDGDGYIVELVEHFHQIRGTK